MENFPEWQEKLRSSLKQVGLEEAAVNELYVALGVATFMQNRHEDELNLTF